MKLILHIGTHKTGTTSIQRALSSKRSELLNLGIWYPNYNEVISCNKSSYAHLDLAKALMNERAALTKEESASFLQGLHKSAVSKSNVHTVLLSGETLLRGKIGSGKVWLKIQNFQKQLRSYINDFEDISVEVTFRDYISYLESLYNEHVKVTNYSKPIMEFYEDYRERFNYKAITSTWNDNVGPVRITRFEELSSGSRLVKNWVEHVLGLEASLLFDNDSLSSNPSWPLYLVEMKRLFNARHSRDECTAFRNKIHVFCNTEEFLSSKNNKKTWLSESQKSDWVCRFENDSKWLAENFKSECIEMTRLPSRQLDVFSSISPEEWLGFIEAEIN